MGRTAARKGESAKGELGEPGEAGRIGRTAAAKGETADPMKPCYAERMGANRGPETGQQRRMGRIAARKGETREANGRMGRNVEAIGAGGPTIWVLTQP